MRSRRNRKKKKQLKIPDRITKSRNLNRETGEVEVLRKKNLKKVISNIISMVLIVMLIGMTLIVIAAKTSGGEPELFSYQLKTVLSGSMAPEFKTGSIILVKRLNDMNSLMKDDVITFKQNNHLVTHRIIEVVKQEEATLYRTKGDKNQNTDMNLVLADNVVAKYTGFTVPLIGYLLSFLDSPIGVAILLIIPGLVLLGYATITILQTIKEIQTKTMFS